MVLSAWWFVVVPVPWLRKEYVIYRLFDAGLTTPHNAFIRQAKDFKCVGHETRRSNKKSLIFCNLITVFDDVPSKWRRFLWRILKEYLTCFLFEIIYLNCHCLETTSFFTNSENAVIKAASFSAITPFTITYLSEKKRKTLCCQELLLRWVVKVNLM